MNADVKLGVSPISWTNNVIHELGGDTPLETCLEEASAAGYTGIEFGKKFPRDPTVLGPLLKRYKLQLVSGWYTGLLADRSVDQELDSARANAELLAGLGSKIFIYGEAGGRPPSPSDQPLSRTPHLSGIDLPGYAAKVSELAEIISREFGLAFSYHFHLMMLVETWEEIDSFFSRTSPSVGMLLDTGHAFAAGASIPRIIDAYGGRINHIHLKDVRPAVLAAIRQNDQSFNDGVRAGMFTVPGDGDVDFAPVSAFVRRGYKGWLVVEAEQDPVKAPPLPTVSRAAVCVRDMFSL